MTDAELAEFVASLRRGLSGLRRRVELGDKIPGNTPDDWLRFIDKMLATVDAASAERRPADPVLGDAADLLVEEPASPAS